MNAALWRLSLALVLIGMMLGFAAPLAAQDKEKDTVVDEILEILRRGGQITEEQKKQLQERAKREERARVLAGVDENLKPYLRSPGDEFRLELGGFVQSDFDATDHDARTLNGLELTDTFLVRRARISLTGQLYKWIGIRIEGDFGTQQNPSFVLTDGYIDLNFMPEIGLRTGQYKQPFSQEELTSDVFVDTIERSLVNELVPARDMGVMLQGQLFDRIFAYSLAVFNGSGINASDANEEKNVAARFTLAPFRNTKNYWLKGLHIGAAGTWGDDDNHNSARGRTLARTSNRFTFFAQQPTRGDRWRWDTELAWLVGPASVKFEYAQQIDQRKGLGPNGSNLDDITATGWYATLTYILTGENSVLNGPVIPRHPFSPLTGQFGPGAFELVARYSELKFSSDDPVDFFDGNINNGITGGGRTAENGAKSITGGLNWYLNSRVRAMVNWSQYWFDNGRGTPWSCQQSACGAANLRDRDKSSWELLTRLQLWF